MKDGLHLLIRKTVTPDRSGQCSQHFVTNKRHPGVAVGPSAAEEWDRFHAQKSVGPIPSAPKAFQKIDAESSYPMFSISRGFLGPESQQLMTTDSIRWTIGT